MLCYAYSHDRAFDIKNFQESLINKPQITDIQNFKQVLSFLYQEEGVVFIFEYGVITIWNLSEDLIQQCLDQCLTWLKPYSSEESIGEIASDTHRYEYGSKFSILDDCLIIPDKSIKTKLAISHGLAQSVELQGFEKVILKTIESTKNLPKNLALHGKVALSRNEIRRMMGKLFAVRSSINLQLELLETPKYFWNHPELEVFYQQIADYLDKKERINVLNQRLEVLHELFDMLGVELNHQHSSMLEWIIILLISIEVIMMLGVELFKFL